MKKEKSKKIQPAAASDVTRFARAAWIAYSKAVGGKSYNGEPLPTWEQMAADTKKKTLVKGWNDAARAVLILHELLAMQTVIEEGYGGIMVTGRIVDRRVHPSAVPLTVNSLMRIPPPKPTGLMAWRSLLPAIEDLDGKSEAYFWVRGGRFNRPLVIRVNHGSRRLPGRRKVVPELNYQFGGDYPEFIWHSDLKQWGLEKLEWAGPILHPHDLA